MSTITYVFLEKQENSQYFLVEKSALSGAMDNPLISNIAACLLKLGCVAADILYPYQYKVSHHCLPDNCHS